MDAKTSLPLENGEIELLPTNGWADDGIPRRPLQNGVFRFDLLAAGRYRAQVYRAPGPSAPPFAQTFEVGGSNLPDMRIVVPVGGRLTGRVKMPPGVVLYELTLMPVGSFAQARARLEPDGSFIFNDIPPGKWSLGFLGSGQSASTTLIAVRQSGRTLGPRIETAYGENPPLEIELGERFFVTGTIVDRNGAPLENATIVFQTDDRRSIPSGGGGSFQIGVPAGEYRVTAWRGNSAEGSFRL